MKFIIGDHIVGTEEADNHYGVTRKNTHWIVFENSPFMITMSFAEEAIGSWIFVVPHYNLNPGSDLNSLTKLQDFYKVFKSGNYELDYQNMFHVKSEHFDFVEHIPLAVNNRDMISILHQD